MATTGGVESGNERAAALSAEVSCAQHESGQNTNFKLKTGSTNSSMLTFLSEQDEAEFKDLEHPDETNSPVQEQTNSSCVSLHCEPVSEIDESVSRKLTNSPGQLSEPAETLSKVSKEPEDKTVELRFLVRRREAGALIGKRGANIKRLRETFRQSIFSIPDTGNGPERVVCIATNEQSVEAILTDFTQLLLEKSPENDDQIEVKLLIHSSHAGSIIGIGGQSIKKLRNDSKAAIKIYEICCPLSSERVCAIKAKPPLVVSTIKLVQSILDENPIKGTIKPYDGLHFDLNLVDKYGGYLRDDSMDLATHSYNQCESIFYNHSVPNFPQKQFSVWRPAEFREPYELFEVHRAHNGRLPDGPSCLIEHQHHQVNMQSMPLESTRQLGGGNQGNDLSSKKCETVDSNEMSSSLSAAHQSVRLSRFHPYAPDQLEFPSSAGRTLVRYQAPFNYSRFQYGQANQQHGQCLRLQPNFMPHSPDSRPFRPSCSCSFLPQSPTLKTKAAPLTQLTKSFNAPKGGPRSAFKKK